jgi:transcriptional regulator with XRE-family HTH domain
MGQKTAPLLPTTQSLLSEFGQRLALARKRRNLTAKLVAERAGMNPMTLRGLEQGRPGVTIGAYMSVMQVLGIEKDIGELAKQDTQGRELQDARLIKGPKQMAFSTQTLLNPSERTDSKTNRTKYQAQPKTKKMPEDFIRSESLSHSIHIPPLKRRKTKTPRSKR